MGRGQSKKSGEKLPDWKQKLEEFRKKLESDDKALQETAKKIVKDNRDSTSTR